MNSVFKITFFFLFFISINDASFADSIPPLHSYKKVAPKGEYVFVMLTEFDPLVTSSGKQYLYSGLYYNDASNIPIWTVDWYSVFDDTIYVSSDGKHLVRVESWTGLTNYDEPSIIFYENGKEIKEYSAFDLVKDPTNLPQTTTVRWWMKNFPGNSVEFDDILSQLSVITKEDKKYVFDIKSGELIEGKDKSGQK